MAGDGIEFRFMSNERDLLRGAGDAETALQDVADALDDVGQAQPDVSFADAVREAKRLEDAADAAADATRAGFDRAEREVDRLERSFDRAEREAKRLGDAGDRAGDDVRRGMGRAGEGLDEFRDEANSTAREAAASFDGSFESIADMGQEIAANAFAGFGPAGAVAGLAAAAGIGLAIAGFEGVNEASEESKQRAADWAAAFIEAGGSILNAQQRVAQLQDIATDPARWQAAQDNARNWGVDLSTAMRAMIGDADALAAANRSLTDRELEAAEGANRIADAGEMLSEQLQGATAETRAGRDALAQLQGEMANGQEAADAYADSLLQLARESGDATVSVDELGNTIYTLPGDVQVAVNAQTGRATTNIESLRDDIEDLPDGHARVDVTVQDRQLRDYLHQNLDRTAYVHIQTRAGRSVPV